MKISLITSKSGGLFLGVSSWSSELELESGMILNAEAQRRREIWELESGVQSSSGYLHFGKTGLFSALRMGLR